ncbi:MAG: hypothetical protein MJE12_02425 [Alphaproteobacteria bacterium]|nr:hypothetical protein [Alphaproteobacteria bacterium]
MKIWFTILLSIALSVSGGVSASVHAALHLAHGVDGVEETFAGASLVLHKALFPHDPHHHDGHHHDKDGDADSNHGSEDHASYCHGYAVISMTTPVGGVDWGKEPRVFEADTLLPEPLYLTEHIPD